MQLREHVSELGRWRTWQRPADASLRACVHGYFAASSRLPAPVRELRLPAAEVPLLLNFGDPHRRLDASGLVAEHDGAWIVGLHDAPELSEAAGEREFMVIRFTPIGAHLFLGAPMHEIARRTVSLADLEPALARRLVAAAGGARDWTERFDAVERIIAERVMGAAPPAAMAWAWRRLASADGRLALGRLAAELDYSHRHLIARFRTHVGMAPKTVARLLRFNRALRSLNAGSGARAGEPAGKPYVERPDARAPAGARIPWADIAADCGYFDQAHFINEFRRFAGATPARFIRSMADTA